MSPLGNTLSYFSRCETKHNLKWREPDVIIRTVTCELQQIFPASQGRIIRQGISGKPSGFLQSNASYVIEEVKEAKILSCGIGEKEG